MRIRILGCILFFTGVLLGVICSFPAAMAAADDNIAGVELIEEVLPVAERNRMRNPQPGEVFPPLRVQLSRRRYWRQDGHMDAVVRLNAVDDVNLDSTHLQGRLHDSNGVELSRFSFVPPGEQFIFYPQLPDHFLGNAEIKLAWHREDGEMIVEDKQMFRVEQYDEPAPREGRVRVEVPNRDGVHARNIPVTMGVPFPRGALAHTDNLRLVDEAGDQLPLQVKETARWSRFGSVKWTLCAFKVTLDGGPRELFLEYGPQVTRRKRERLSRTGSGGFPVIDAGRLRFDEGLWFDPHGDGQYEKVLDAPALTGAFVEHEDGRLYSMPSAETYEVEEQGPEKMVIRRKGWYREVESDREFCQYVVRYVIHRDAPLVRIFLTWIFTGDGNRDRIAHMGWRFDLADGFEKKGFLPSFGADGVWKEGDYLLQYDHENFEINDGGTVKDFPGGRAAGAAKAQNKGVSLYFGTKDFWQNYPSELEFRDGALLFNNWPRHNKPAVTSYDLHNLDETQWTRNAIRLRFAHEGQALDFRLPDSFAEPRIWEKVSGGHEADTHWLPNDPETANAQGIARTEEMWLYLTPAESEDAGAVRVLEALDSETLRAVADPKWVAQSGAFYEMHHQDFKNYPEEESIYERVAHAPWRWIERLGTYGMWIYGDVPTWGLNLGARTASLYRTFRARHHGWPYSWIPFVRSGDSDLLKYAEAATRQMTDAAYCHYYSEDVERGVGETMSRRKGIWVRSLIPWTGRQHPDTRAYEAKVNFMWYAYYLTGYHRARDVALCWGEQAKVEEDMRRRGPIQVARRDGITVFKSFIEMYEATFDPWFLVAALSLGEATLWAYENADWSGHFWVPADREYLRFTGCERFREYYMTYADRWGHPDMPSWGRLGAPMIEPNAYAWFLTGDDYYLRRTLHFPDQANAAVYEADTPEYLYGFNTQGSSHMIFYGWYLRLLPTALWAMERAGERPTPIGNKIYVRSSRNEDFLSPVMAMKKESGQPLPVRFSGASAYSPGEAEETAGYVITGPSGEKVLSGTWHVRRAHEVEIPAQAPGGVYRVQIQYSKTRGVDVPLSPVGTPEVFELEPGQAMHPARRENRYWFMVPENVESFEVKIPLGGGTRRMTIRGPDGERVWDMSYHPSIYDGKDPVRVEIEVEPEQAGRLWELTLPGHSLGFQMGTRIPPVYAVDATRWFMPEPAH